MPIIIIIIIALFSRLFIYIHYRLKTPAEIILLEL